MSQLNLTQIGQIAVNVSDIGRSLPFYRDVLGMTFQFQVPNMAFFDCGGVRIMLTTDGGEQRNNSVIYYKTDDLEAAHASLQANAVTIVQAPHLIAKMPDHELWMCFFHDPDQNILALMSEVRD